MKYTVQMNVGGKTEQRVCYKWSDVSDLILSSTGYVHILTTNEDDRMSEINELTGIALSMYVGEPCRICGCLLTVNDVKAGAVFAGYSKDNKSRAAHKLCWNNATDIYSAAIAAKDIEIERLGEWYDEAQAVCNALRQTADNIGAQRNSLQTRVDELTDALESLRKKKHYECEDCWYSCPKSENYCGDDRRDVCKCGMDHINTIIDKALKGGE